MKTKILNQFNKNTTPFIGSNKKYNTVYIIEFDNGQFYVGKHTSDDIYKDTYFCSGDLAQKVKKSGVKYERSVLFFTDTPEEAINLETDILSNKSIYDDPLCLNCYPGSPTDLTGTTIVSKGNKFKMINPKRLELMIEAGWKHEGIKRITVSKDDVLKFILPEEVDVYIADGWSFGNCKSKDKIFITDGKKFCMIKKDLLPTYEMEGWYYQHNQTGMKVLKCGDDIIKVRPEDVEKYINIGYIPASTVSGLVCVLKNKEYLRIHPDELQKYISDGWTTGNNTTGTIFINNGAIELRIYEEDINLYPNFVSGRIEKVYLNNGVIEQRIRIIDVEKMKIAMDSGFVTGKLTRIKKIKIYKDRFIKVILPEKLSQYITEGWTDIFDVSIHWHPRLA